MSYTMDFEDGGKITKEDTIMEYEGFRLVSDAMSLLYLFGKAPESALSILGQQNWVSVLTPTQDQKPCNFLADCKR